MTEAVGRLIFVIVLLGIGVVIGMVIGMVVHGLRTADERAQLAERERQLQAEWDALEQTQRINEEFWRARTAMRDEALRRPRYTGVFHYQPER